SMFQENARRFTPIWLAARPARPSASTVSTRSLTRERTVWSMLVIFSQGVRSTGSPTIRMSRKAMVIFSLIRTHARYIRQSEPRPRHLRNLHTPPGEMYLYIHAGTYWYVEAAECSGDPGRPDPSRGVRARLQTCR